MDGETPVLPTPPEALKAQGSVIRWFANNLFIGLVASIASIVSLPVAIYFGVGSGRYRELSMFVNPVRTIIVRSGRSSDLHVLYRGQPVSTDVTALQVVLWNAGNESIKPEHVLEPVILRADPRVPILEAKLYVVNRPLTKIALDTAHVADGQVGISWRILEHNDGAVIQFIVAGPVNEKISARGSLEGQSSIGSSWNRVGEKSRF
jgi:hypothetical protein